MTDHIDDPANGSDNQLGTEGMAEARRQHERDQELELLEEYKTDAIEPADDGLDE